MATNSLSKMPGYRNAEYLLILSPHEDLRNRIMNVKKEFADTHKATFSTGGKPYITLVRFNVWEMMEEKIINSLKPIAMASPAFKVHLKDYGSFPTHTIYIDVASKVPIQNLVKELKAAKRLMKSPAQEPHFITEPY